MVRLAGCARRETQRLAESSRQCLHPPPRPTSTPCAVDWIEGAHWIGVDGDSEGFLRAAGTLLCNIGSERVQHCRLTGLASHGPSTRARFPRSDSGSPTHAPAQTSGCCKLERHTSCPTHRTWRLSGVTFTSTPSLARPKSSTAAGLTVLFIALLRDLHRVRV